MPEADFGNEQDMYVDDKQHPTLGPTEEAQDVASLERIVVPVGAFNDPNNPLAAAGTVNVSVNDHPMPHSEDYGADVQPGTHEMQNPLSDGLRGLAEDEDTSASGTKKAAADASGLNDDERDSWSKSDWKTKAQSLGLATSGNTDTLKSRVEEHEAEASEREQYEKEVHSMSREDMDKEAAKYDVDAERYSTKELLAEAVIASAYDESVPPGDKSSEQ